MMHTASLKQGKSNFFCYGTIMNTPVTDSRALGQELTVPHGFGGGLLSLALSGPGRGRAQPQVADAAKACETGGAIPAPRPAAPVTGGAPRGVPEAAPAAGARKRGLVGCPSVRDSWEPL